LPLLHEDTAVAGADKSAIQYWYSFMRDLADAWNELRNVAACYKGICGIARSKNPNHLILGGIPEERPPFYYDVFRTVFQQPQVKSGEAATLRRMKFLHWRLVMMIKSFFVPGSDWDDTASNSYLHAFADRNSDNPEDIASKISLPLRLTPSLAPDQPLGRRTIPFYYDLADHPQSLHWNWDYDAALSNTARYLLSYHSDNDTASDKTGGYEGTRSESYTSFPEAIHPFAFDFRGFTFIRIEGLTGRSSQDKAFPEIVAALEKLKKQYCIAFDIVMKEVGQDSLDCHRGIDHLGGVYHRGEFIIVIAALPSQPGWFRIVGDFTLLP
jgi:hypothetical protein